MSQGNPVAPSIFLGVAFLDAISNFAPELPGSADVCYDSPDGKILSILTKEQENNSSIVLEFLIYYISGCPSDFQPSELLEKAILFTALVPSLGALSGAFIAARDQIQETCGTDVTPLTTASKVAAEGLCRFSSTIQGIRELMVGLDSPALLFCLRGFFL